MRTPMRDSGGPEVEADASLPRGDQAGSPLVQQVLNLQRTAGNEAVARLLQRFPWGMPVAVADTAAAKKLFQKGAAAYDQRQFAHAYDFFTRAGELSPRSSVLFSRAQALRRLGGRREEAIALFEDYLNMPDITRKKDAEEALAELR